MFCQAEAPAAGHRGEGEWGGRGGQGEQDLD